MAILDPETQERLEAYLEADTRYSVAPLPTPAEPATATAFTMSRVSRSAPLEKLRRLSRLTIFHQLNGTAKPWELMLVPTGEANPAEVEKSAHAVACLAWIGDEKQRKNSSDFYRGLLKRADAEKSRDALVMACIALGPAEGTAELKTWADARATRLEAEFAKPDPTRSKEVSNNLQTRADMIRQFTRLDVPRIERCFQTRRKLDAIPEPAKKIPRLAALYCETDPESDTDLVWWSAVSLNRLVVADPKNLPAIASAFSDIAKQYDRKDEKLQPEIDATRARSLRAVIYFGGVLDKTSRKWLDNQVDTGNELLVLRPSWQYPAAHSHAAAEPAHR